MGGVGSGNRFHRRWPGKKTVVESCLSIDANRWTRDGLLKAGVHLIGSCRWTYRNDSGFTLECEVDTRDPGSPFVRLRYPWSCTTSQQQESVGYRVDLTSTRPRFGGLRWWFVCPLAVDGRPCSRRVGKLYLPPRARHFGCRHCHDLTYTSCQESRK
jgi:hypothetical protein